MELGTILGVWAHPDDETYLSGSIMADAIARGQRVVCATATKGEAGSQDHERWPPSEIAKVREAELIESLSILGVTEHHWLGYEDGRCPEVPREEAIGRVVELMTEVRPDSVLTFGPEGMTGHPDHIAVSEWTTEAFERAAPPGAKLYYASVSDEWAGRWVPRLTELNVFEPGTPIIVPTGELAIHLVGEGDLADRKLRAIRAQVSQVDSLVQVFGEDSFRQAMAEEAYRLALTK